jgi:acetyl-CoA carboxylase beta subunit
MILSVDEQLGHVMRESPEIVAGDEIEQLDLTCPGCGTDLLANATYNDWRVCGVCGRHFWVSARERAVMIARTCDFTELEYNEPRADALDQHQRLSAPDRQDDARERTALADAVVTAQVSLGGGSVIAALLDGVLLPSGIGIVTADKLIAAIREAIHARMPMVIVCGGGSQTGPSGLLHGAQSLRLSGAIAELHRNGLPLISVVAHPSRGNLLSGVVVNSDIRLAEPGSSGLRELTPDEIVARPDLINHIADVLDYLRRRGGPDVVLANSGPGVTAKLAMFAHQPAVAIAIQSAEWGSSDDWGLVRRAQRIAANLRLPIVFSISGRAALSLESQADLRDMLLRHREAVIAVVEGELNPAHLNLLTVDSVLALDSLAIPGRTSKRFSAQETRLTGLVDEIAGSDPAIAIARAVDQAARMSSARRFDRRLKAAVGRGSEVAGSAELTRLELRDLKELQANVVRSVEEFRHRFEQREFNLPTLAQIQALPAFRNLNLPKLQMTRPDLIEMRDRFIARRKGTHVSESDRPE